MQDQINDLYEQLVYLDEIAGQLDPETNAKTDAQRAEILKEINELKKCGSRWG